jgi:hypothetical protein
VVAVIVPPGPIFLLFPRRKLAEVAVRIAVRFRRPAVVIDNFVVVPHVIIGVVGVVNAIVMGMSARHAGDGTCECGGQTERAYGNIFRDKVSRTIAGVLYGRKIHIQALQRIVKLI